MNKIYEFFMNLIGKGSTIKGDWDSLTAPSDTETPREKEIAQYDQARYMSGILLTMVSAINDVIGWISTDKGFITKHGAANVSLWVEALELTAKSFTKTFYMIDQDKKIAKNYRMSRLTVYQVIESSTMLVDNLSSIPGLDKHPMVLAINAGANVIGALSASSAKAYAIDFQDTKGKLTGLFTKYGIDGDAEVSKIINTNNSEKYVGDNWTLIAPFTDFFMKLMSVQDRGMDPSLFGDEDKAKNITKDEHTAISVELDSNVVIDKLQDYLASINASGLDKTWIFGKSFSSNEAFNMMRALQDIFGMPLMVNMPEKNKASEIYDHELKSLYDKYLNNSGQYNFEFLVKRNGIDKEKFLKMLSNEKDPIYQIAARYALLKGNSFIIIGIEYLANGNHNNLYLDDSNVFTEKFVSARLEYLNFFTYYNLIDSGEAGQNPTLPYGDKTWEYVLAKDFANGIQFGNQTKLDHLGNFPLIVSKQGVFSEYLFDLESLQGKNNKIIKSSKGSDDQQIVDSQIFGGNGDDEIHFGYDGNDYVEGRYGNDTYKITGTSNVLHGEDKGHHSLDIDGDEKYIIEDFSGKYIIDDEKGNDNYKVIGSSDKKTDITINDQDGEVILP